MKDGTLGPMSVKAGDWAVYWSDGTVEAMAHAEFVALPEAEIDYGYKSVSGKSRGGKMSRMLANEKRQGTLHEVMHDSTFACTATPRCKRAQVILGEEAIDIHTAATDDNGQHSWHAWISNRAEVGIGATEMEAIESLGRIHAALDCGFCGKNLAECECPKPV